MYLSEVKEEIKDENQKLKHGSYKQQNDATLACGRPSP